jgi:hypothetical protein
MRAPDADSLRVFALQRGYGRFALRRKAGIDRLVTLPAVLYSPYDTVIGA